MKKIWLLLAGCTVCTMLNAAVVAYPGTGNIDFEEGTVELWCSLPFDPEQRVEKPIQPATLFSLDLPGDPYKNNFAIALWMHPQKNGTQYNAIRVSLWVDGKGVGGPAIPMADWRKNQLNHIAFSWQDGKGSLYLNGKKCWNGKFAMPAGKVKPAEVSLLVGSRAPNWQKLGRERRAMLPEVFNLVTVEAVRVSSSARTFQEGMTVTKAPAADPATLLLDCFDKADFTAKKTNPAVISDGNGEKKGRIIGMFHIVDGKLGKGLALYPDRPLGRLVPGLK